MKIGTKGRSALVTGAAGFIGSHLVDRLLADGWRVTGVDNFDPFYSPQEKRGNLAAAVSSDQFRLVEADVAQYDGLARAVGAMSPDVVVHLAGKGGVRPSLLNPGEYHRVNVVGTRSVLRLAEHLKTHRFVFASSSSVYGNLVAPPFSEEGICSPPASPYAATKRAGEMLAEEHHARNRGTVTCLRLFTVYGPRQRPDLAVRKFSSLMVRGKAIPLFGNGESARDYTWIDDTIEGIVSTLSRTLRDPGDYQIINLGSGQSTRLRRLVALLSEALELNPAIQWLPPQAGDLTSTEADISRAARLLDYHPRVGLEEGIRRFVEWFRQAPGKRVPSLRM